MAVRHADEGLELQLIDHLLLQIEEWVSYLGGAI